MKIKNTTIAIAAAIVLFGCKKISSDELNAGTDNTVSQRAQTWFEQQDVILQSSPEWPKIKYYPTVNMLITPLQQNNTGQYNNTDRYIVMAQNQAGEIGSGYYCFVSGQGNNPEVTPTLLNSAVPGDFNGIIVKYHLDGSLIAAEQYDNGTGTSIDPGIDQSSATKDTYIHPTPHTQNVMTDVYIHTMPHKQ